MLTLFHNGNEYPIQNTEYYIRELANGLDEVIFDLSIYDPIYAIMAEEENIVDRAGQTYKVKQIDAGGSTAKIVCQLDIDAWKASISVNYNSGSKTVYQQINAVKPAGWTVADHSLVSISRTIEGDFTPYDVCVRCTEVYGVYVRWNNKTKYCHIYTKTMGNPVGAFATRELNLKEINYKGKSNDLITRLYAYGKDGLSFASINGGKPYVDNNTYSSRVICGYWEDERYTVAADLLADAQKKLAVMAKPDRSYDCSIIDLQATNPELYNNLDFSLFTVATLIDDVKETAVNYQVVERHIFPYHPEENEVIFDSSPQKITASVVNIVEEIENPNSDFRQIQNQRISEATNWLVSGAGYVVAVKDNNGQWKELLFMDTDDISTAQDVLRINKNGIGFSTNGVNGPYTNAWTIDGNLIADFITSGTINANNVRVIGKIEATSGYIGDSTNGWNIGTKAIYNGPSSLSDTSTPGTYVGTDGIRSNGSFWGTPGATVVMSGGGLQSNTIIKAATVQAGSISGSNSVSGGWFELGSQAELNVINGRFNNYNGYITQSSPDSTQFAFLHLAGSTSTGRYVPWSGSSDRRLKENIKPIVLNIREFIKKLQPVQFNYKADDQKQIEYGLIAQDLEQVFEDCGVKNPGVIGELEGEEHYKYIAYQKMVGLLIPAIQDLYVEVDNLKKRVEALENG